MFSKKELRQIIILLTEIRDELKKPTPIPSSVAVKFGTPISKEKQ